MKLEGSWLLDLPLDNIQAAAFQLEQLRPMVESVEKLLGCEIALFFDHTPSGVAK